MRNYSLAVKLPSISSAAEQNAANSQETTASIEQVLSLTDEIANGSGKIKEGTDLLTDVVQSYRL